MKQVVFEYALGVAKSTMPVRIYMAEKGFKEIRVVSSAAHRQVIQVVSEEDEMLLTKLVLSGEISSSDLFQWARENHCLIAPNKKTNRIGTVLDGPKARYN